MFQYPFSDYLWLYLLAIVFWSLVFGIIRIVKRQIARNNVFYFLLLSVAFSFLGLTIGIHIGLSESPVIGVIIPALLTFIGGIMIYAFVFTDKHKMQDGYVLLTIMISLSFFLMMGSDYACSVRTDYDAKEQDYLYAQKKDFQIFENELAKGKLNQEIPTSTADTATMNLFNKITQGK
jgi:hypothetical protein